MCVLLFTAAENSQRLTLSRLAKEKLTARQKNAFLRVHYLKRDGTIWLFCFKLATLIQAIKQPIRILYL